VQICVCRVYSCEYVRVGGMNANMCAVCACTVCGCEYVCAGRMRAMMCV